MESRMRVYVGLANAHSLSSDRVNRINKSSRLDLSSHANYNSIVEATPDGRTITAIKDELKARSLHRGSLIFLETKPGGMSELTLDAKTLLLP
jgi:hypothetical protein